MVGPFSLVTILIIYDILHNNIYHFKTKQKQDFNIVVRKNSYSCKISYTFYNPQSINQSINQFYSPQITKTETDPDISNVCFSRLSFENLKNDSSNSLSATLKRPDGVQEG